MNDGDALLAAILANPDEDTPRLAYADWLDERGGPGDADRAFVIRFQCDPRNRGAHDGTREYACIERHASDWLMLSALSGRKRNRRFADWYLSDHGPPNLMLRLRRRPREEDVWVELPIRRGFFAEVEGPAAWWLRCGGAILAAHPVKKVVLTSSPLAQSEGTVCWLHDDPEQRRLAWSDVAAVRAPDVDPNDVFESILEPMLRLRFGHRIEFTLLLG